MQLIKNPVARFFIYIFLTLFVLLTSIPFLWTTLQSLKNVRQANSRTPLFIFKPTLESYAQLWLRSVPENMPMLALGLIAVILLITLIAALLHRRGAPGLIIWAVIIAGIAMILWAIPKFVDTADFYQFFVNTVIVTTATVTISIGVSTLAGYALARYRGIDGVVVLIAALAFRALPRMAFALPYFQLATMTGLQDSLIVLTLVLVATNQPFAVWMLRSFLNKRGLKPLPSVL